eukprot:5550607-Pyramimonas_sp.AAC.1
MENVDEMEKDTPNTEWLYKCFLTRGYEISQFTADSRDYGVPHRRKRVFFIAFHLDTFGLGAEEARAISGNVADMVHGFRVQSEKPWTATQDLARI